MTRHDVVQGLYFAWFFLSFVVVPVSFTAWVRFRKKDDASQWFAAGICSVWFWSALSLGPWNIYVHHALKDDMSQWPFLGNHPFVMVCIVGVISGGLMLIRGFTSYWFGNRLALLCAGLAFCMFLLGGWLSNAGVF